MKDDILEALLAYTPQIDDDGFTEALIARLPARRPVLWVRAAIPIAASVVACGVAAAVPGARGFAAEMGIVLAGSAMTSGTNPLVIAGVMALLLGGALAAGTSET